MTAQFGDLILSGDIQNSNGCHSIVVSGVFSRQTQSGLNPDRITLSLYIDGVESESGSLDATLQVDDPTVETIIGDPDSASGAGILLSPIILNTNFSAPSPLTLAALSQQLCDGS